MIFSKTDYQKLPRLVKKELQLPADICSNTLQVESIRLTVGTAMVQALIKHVNRLETEFDKQLRAGRITAVFDKEIVHSVSGRALELWHLDNDAEQQDED